MMNKAFSIFIEFESILEFVLIFLVLLKIYASQNYMRTSE